MTSKRKLYSPKAIQFIKDNYKIFLRTTPVTDVEINLKQKKSFVALLFLDWCGRALIMHKKKDIFVVSSSRVLIAVFRFISSLIFHSQK